VSSYIHLNPARAKLFDVQNGRLADYRWSSYPAYLRPARRPGWLTVKRVLSCFDCKDDPQGRRRYREHMGKRVVEIACSDRPWEVDERWARIRRGWCLGGEEFRDALLGRLAPGGCRESFSGDAMRLHDENEAERLVCAGLEYLQLSEEDLGSLRKGSDDKALLAWLVRRHTSVPNAWIAQRLRMGRADCLSRYPKRIAESADRTIVKRRNALLKITRIRD
jgi:hypothetical protein